MNIVDFSRRAIEQKIANVGDFVKMDYLNECLRKPLDFDAKRFVMTKLASLYEARLMHSAAGKLMRSGAEINPNFNGKISDFLKSAELFVKAGIFEETDLSMKKAMGGTTEVQKREIKDKIKEFYKTEANFRMKRGEKKYAMKVYEKLMSMELDSNERKKIEDILIKIYENFGKMKEYINLNREKEPVVSIPEKTPSSFKPNSYIGMTGKMEIKKDFRKVAEKNTDFDINEYLSHI